MSRAPAPASAVSRPETPWSLARAGLIRLVQPFAADLTLERAAEQALDVVGGCVPCDRLSLALVVPDTGRLHLLASKGIRDARPGQDLTRPRSVSDWVLRAGRGVVLQGSVRTAQMRGSADSQVQSSITVPLHGVRGPMGLVSLGRGGAHPPFAEGELESAATALVPLAMALASIQERSRGERALAALDAAAFAGHGLLHARALATRDYEIAVAAHSSWEHDWDLAILAPHDDGTHTLLVADVPFPGVRGLECARFLEGALLAGAAGTPEPVELTMRIERAFVRQFGHDAPCGLWLGHLGRSGRVRACALGIPSSYSVPSGDGDVLRADFADPPAGGSRGERPTEQDVRLLPGDALVCVTDGVEEASDASGMPYGAPRIAEVLSEWRDRSLETLARAVCDAALAHTGRAWPRDDMLVVGLRHRRED